VSCAKIFARVNISDSTHSLAFIPILSFLFTRRLNHTTLNPCALSLSLILIHVQSLHGFNHTTMTSTFLFNAMATATCFLGYHGLRVLRLYELCGDSDVLSRASSTSVFSTTSSMASAFTTMTSVSTTSTTARQGGFGRAMTSDRWQRWRRGSSSTAARVLLYSTVDPTLRRWHGCSSTIAASRVGSEPDGLDLGFAFFIF
jgi:hypothetical protein